jgi:hypothetical protein
MEYSASNTFKYTMNKKVIQCILILQPKLHHDIISALNISTIVKVRKGKAILVTGLEDP